MHDRFIEVQNYKIPSFLYGTAWKEEETERLTELALQAGFLGIDTANQRRHYHEKAVGAGIQNYLEKSNQSREALFLQTKFTLANGQDHRKPYNGQDPLSQQVEQSFLSSLEHLQTDYIDSYVLHGPHSMTDLINEDWEVWHAMEKIQESGKTKVLGVSNVNLQQLSELYEGANVKPTFVQNRCFAIRQWDLDIRQYCYEHNIIYQGFSLLTANQEYLLKEDVLKLAKSLSKTIPQIIFRFALEVNMIPLTGTTQLPHMEKDLEVYDFHLDESQVKLIEKIALR